MLPDLYNIINTDKYEILSPNIIVEYNINCNNFLKNHIDNPLIRLL